MAGHRMRSPHDPRRGHVERPLLGNGHGGCGRRLGETHRWKHRQGTPSRPHGGERCVGHVHDQFLRQGRSAPHQNCQSRFLRYLGRRDELALWSAYELGREGLPGGVSLFDVVQIHHRVLVDVLNDTGGTQLQDVSEP
jgi:ribosomal protein L34E